MRFSLFDCGKINRIETVCENCLDFFWGKFFQFLFETYCLREVKFSGEIFFKQ